MAFIDGDNGENFMTVMGLPRCATESKVKDTKYYDNTKSYSITLEQQQQLYDKEFNELMALSKEELVKKLIGERPPLNVIIG